MEEKSLAYEMLEELKRSNERLERTANQSGKRWFVISIVELIIIVSMILGYFIYNSNFEYEKEVETYQTIDSTELENSTISQNMGE